jgi:hypothetical protein
MPKLVNAYNYSHGHGDHFRQRITSIEPKQKNKGFYTAAFVDSLCCQMNNSYLYYLYGIINKKSSQFLMYEFLHDQLPYVRIVESTNIPQQISQKLTNKQEV